MGFYIPAHSREMALGGDCARVGKAAASKIKRESICAENTKFCMPEAGAPPHNCRSSGPRWIKGLLSLLRLHALGPWAR